MRINHLSAEQIADAVKTLEECTNLVDEALKQAKAEGDPSIRATPAFRDANKRIHDTCALLGVPVPPFFDEINNGLYH